MSTAELRESIIRWANSVEDESKLTVAFNALKGIDAEGRISVDRYNKELDQARDEIASGDAITHEQMLKEIASW